MWNNRNYTFNMINKTWRNLTEVFVLISSLFFPERNRTFCLVLLSRVKSMFNSSNAVCYNTVLELLTLTMIYRVLKVMYMYTDFHPGFSADHKMVRPRTETIHGHL